MEPEEHEACYHITSDECPDGYWVYVSKVDGGTIGKLYKGEDWIVSLAECGDVSFERDIIFCEKIHIGREVNHYMAAFEAVVFFEDWC